MGCEDADELGCDKFVVNQPSVNLFCLHCSHFTSDTRSQGSRKVIESTFCSQTVKPSNVYKKKPFPDLSMSPSHPLLYPTYYSKVRLRSWTYSFINTNATGGRHGPNLEHR